MPPAAIHVKSTVKILVDQGDSLKVAGYGVVFGGKDLVGDTFSAQTDLWLDKLSATPPVLFDHGGDELLKRQVVGRVVKTKVDTFGLWIEAKLDANAQYLAAIRKLVEKGALGWSSGAVGHLVERAKGGKLLSWAIAEFSLTATPCEPRTLGVQQVKALAALDPDFEKAVGIIDMTESFEDRMVRLRNAAVQKLGIAQTSGDGPWLSVLGTFDDHVLVSVYRYEPKTSTEYWDLPYTLNADGEPEMGEPQQVEQAYVSASSKARAAELLVETKPYRIQKRDGQFCVIGPNGKQHGCHDTRTDALAQQRALYANEGKAMEPNDLDDAAFAFIEAEGTLDDHKKTTPRAKRHFPHHRPDGAVDHELLAAAVEDATERKDIGPRALAHLKRHAEAADGVDDAHNTEWAPDASAAVLLRASVKLHDLAEAIAADQVSMRHLGIDTKSSRLLRSEREQEAREIRDTLQEVLDASDYIARGEDGKAVVELNRAYFDLLEMEVAL